MCEETSPWHLRQRYNISRQSPCVSAGLAGEEVVGLARVGGEVVELGDGVLPDVSAIEPRGELIPAVGCGDRGEGDPEERRRSMCDTK